jgi:hypothetical protein
MIPLDAGVHDVVAKDFTELACHALQQLDIFPRKHAAMLVLGVNDTDQRVLPAAINTSAMRRCADDKSADTQQLPP